MDAVIASGKTSLIPIVRRRLQDVCNNKPLKVNAGFDEKECVAQGAAIEGRDSRHRWRTPGRLSRFRGCMRQPTASWTGGAKGLGTGSERAVGSSVPRHEGRDSPRGCGTEGDTHRSGHGRARAAGIALSAHGRYEVARGIADCGNPDVTFIDDIKVEMPRNSRLGRILINMWLGKDGLLEAEASVEGSNRIFKPEPPEQVQSGKMDAQ